MRIGLQIKTFFISVYEAGDEDEEENKGEGGIPQGRSSPSVATPNVLQQSQTHSTWFKL